MLVIKFIPNKSALACVCVCIVRRNHVMYTVSQHTICAFTYLISCYRTAWLVSCKAAWNEGLKLCHWTFKINRCYSMKRNYRCIRKFRAINLVACLLVNSNVSIWCNFFRLVWKPNLVYYKREFANDSMRLLPMLLPNVKMNQIQGFSLKSVNLIWLDWFIWLNSWKFIAHSIIRWALIWNGCAVGRAFDTLPIPFLSNANELI